MRTHLTRLQEALTGCADGLCFVAAPHVGCVVITVHESVQLEAGQVAVIVDWATVGRCLFETGIRDDGTVDRQAITTAMAQIFAGVAGEENEQ